MSPEKASSEAERERQLIEAEMAHMIGEERLNHLTNLRRSVLRERSWYRLFTGVALFLGICGIVVGSIGIISLNNFLDQRAENLITACGNDRETQLQLNDSLQESINIVLFIAEQANVTDPEVIAAVSDRVGEIQAKKVEVRQCDDESIRRYYETNGIEGDEPPTDRFGNEVPDRPRGT